MVAIYKLEKTLCGHEGVIRPVLKKGGKCEGKWQCVISGPIPTAKNQKTKTLYCEASVEAARQRIAKYLKTESNLVVLTSIDKNDNPVAQTFTPPGTPVETAAAGTATKETAPVTPNEPKSELELQLKALRMKFAKQQDLPPYCIFNNKTLHDLLQKKPTDLEHLVQVRGIKKVKAQKYGDAILNVVRLYA